MSDRQEYFRRRYLNDRENQLEIKRIRYLTDEKFRERQRIRDKKNYNYKKTWGGLLDISSDIFVCEMNLKITN